MTDSKTLSAHAFVWFSVICQVKHTITYKIVLRAIFFVKDAVVFHQPLFTLCWRVGLQGDSCFRVNEGVV